MVVYLGLGGAPINSAQFVVTSPADAGPGSLRQGMLDANAAGGGTLDCSTLSGTIVLASELPTTTSSVAIVGPGPNWLAISGSGAVRIFSFAAGTTNLVRGITLRDGWVTNNANGGGIHNGGALTLVSCALIQNRSLGGFGGAIYNTGDLTLIDSTFISNSVTGEAGESTGTGSSSAGSGGGGAGLGGAVWTGVGAVVVTDCSFVSNLAVGGTTGATPSDSLSSGGRGGGLHGGIGGTSTTPGGSGGYAGGGGGAEVGGGPAGSGGFGGGGGGGSDLDGVTVGAGGFGGGNGSAAEEPFTTVLGGEGGGGGGFGGALFIESGTVSLLRCDFEGNAVLGGAGIGSGGGAGLGGGVFVNAGRVDLLDSTLAQNRAAGGSPGFGYSRAGRPGAAAGGGIFIRDGEVTAAGSTLAANQSSGSNAVKPLRGDEVTDGAPARGGAICAEAGTLALTNCTISGNVASGGDGSFGRRGGDSRGGGLFVGTGSVTVANVTIASNACHAGLQSTIGFGLGGGVYNEGGALTLRNTMLTGNVGTTNSPGLPLHNPNDGAGSVMSQGGNLVTTTESLTGLGPSDLLQVEAALGPLQDNGGPTWTHALSTNSPAVDSGVASGAPLTDQRGLRRPVGEGFDIGAYEVEELTILVDGTPAGGETIYRTNSAVVDFRTPFDGATIRYTLDGSVPSQSSPVYVGPITLTTSAVVRGWAYTTGLANEAATGPLELVVLPLFNLTLATNGNGVVTIAPAGGSYVSNTVVRLEAEPQAGWAFVNWGGHVTGTSEVVLVLMNGPKTVSALFEPYVEFTLFTTTVGSGTVAIDPPGTRFASNTVITVTAVPSPGWRFAGWSGDANGSEPVVQVLMNQDRAIHAVFEPTSAVLVLTFDDLPGSSGFIPSEYLGFQWHSPFGSIPYMNPALTGGVAGTGYEFGLVSAPNLAHTPLMSGDSWFGPSQGSFNLFSGYFTAAGDVGLRLRVLGYDGATLKYDNTYALSTTSSTLVNLDYFGITQVVFAYAGGVDGFPEWNLNVVMDNLAYSLSTAEPPVILTQPADQRVAVGEPAAFHVVAASPSPLTYEWLHDGTPIGAGSASNLVLEVIGPEDEGLYSVKVSNDGGSVTSLDATLVVVSGTFASVTATPLGIELHLNGEPGIDYTLEVSSDLRVWDPLTTWLDTPATWTYLDSTAPLDQPRFYRLKRGP